MAIRLRIKYKILFLVLSVTGLIYVASVGYIVSSTREVILRDTYETVLLSAERAAYEVSCRFEQYMSASITLADAFSSFTEKPLAQWQREHLDMMGRVYATHPDLIALWDSYEFSCFKPDYNKPYGRVSRAFLRNAEGGIDTSNMILSLTGDTRQYAEFKARNIASIWEPYLDITSTNLANRVLMTTVAAPMRKDGQFAGLVACDIALDWLQKLVFSLQPYEGSTAFLLSNEGTIAAYPSDSLLMKPIEFLFPQSTAREGLREAIKTGRTHTFTTSDRDGRQHYIAIVPVKMYQSNVYWALGIRVPVEVIQASANRSLRIALLVGLVALLVLVVILVNVSNHISKPIEAVTATLRTLGRGSISEDLKLHIATGNEIEDMAHALNALIDGLGTKNRLAERIGHGDLTQDIALLSEDDTLGQSLIGMRNSLREAQALQAARERENAQRTWASQGLATFGELLRSYPDNFDELCDQLLRRLIEFVGAQQGGLYLLDDELAQRTGEREYYLKSAFAWDRKRYLENRIPYGVGLVGACAMEREVQLVTDVPPHYSTILAGVGEAEPRALVFLPLLHEEESLGVIELASFNMFEPHVVDFLRSLSLPVASSFFSVRVGVRTRQLLQQSREQAEALANRDEELHQNLEALRATQEEASRRSAETDNLIRTLASMMYYVEYNLDGFITDASDRYLARIGRRRELVVGSHFADIITVPGWSRMQYEDFWHNLRHGTSQRLECEMTIDGTTVHLTEFYIPIKNQLNEVLKIIKLSYEQWKA